ncbi:MAG: ComEC family competence protein [Bacteroidales bacterium]|nr:ComEC family competence protein [Bacteroidales bacterium]
MNPWKPFPLIRLLIPFLCGIAYALIQPGEQPEILWLAGATGLLMLGLLLFTLTGNLPYRMRWIQGCFIFLLMVCLGGLTVRVYHVNRQEAGGWHSPAFPAEICEPPSHTSKRVKLILTRYEPEMETGTLIRKGKVVLFLEKDSNALALRYGDWILVSVSLKPLQDESNPYGFDPAGYYRRKGIYAQGWVAPTDWKLTGIPESNSLKRLALGVRDRLLKILKENDLKGEEFAVASAILLGYTGDIGSDLRKGFAASGAMHILAVSGMHVGIIFLFLETLLAVLKRRKFGRLIKAFLMILMIWCYAMVTGLSPPVFRAALMISLIILGKTLRRKPDSLNVVGGAMMTLLLLDPTLLLHLGFQFSFLAVFGILFLYKPLFSLMPSRGWVLTRVWGLMAVSIAAQIATFPMALYAFHQFPNYFLLTNMLVLPLASLVIYNGIGVLVLSPFPVFSALLAKTLSFIVWLLNTVIRFIEELPGSVSGGIYMHWIEVALLYGVIVSIACFLFFQKARWVYTFLGLLLLWSTIGFLRDDDQLYRNRMMIFKVNGASQYLFIQGQKAVFLKDYQAACVSPDSRQIVSVIIPAEGITRSATGYLTENDSRIRDDRREFGFFFRRGDFLQFSDYRMIILSNTLPSTLTDTMDVNMVILRKNPDIEIQRVVRCFHPEQIVIDPNNSWYRIRKWKEQAEKLNISCYSVADEGAFILETKRADDRIRWMFPFFSCLRSRQ